MKLDFNKKNTTIAVYAFIVIACSILFYTIVNNMAGVGRYIRLFFRLIAPFIYAFCIAYLLNPLMKQCDRWFKFVEKKKPNPKLKRGLSVLVTFIICLIVIGGFGWIVSHQIAESIVLFANRVRVWIPEVGAWITNFIKKNNFFAEYELQITNALSQLGNMALKFSETSLPVLWGGIKNLTTGITNFVLAVIISIYMLYDKEKFISGIKKVLGAIFKEKKKDAIVNIFADVNRIFSKFIIGKIIDSLIIGVICTIGMIIFRMPFPPLVGFIVGVTNIIPYFGPFIGAGIGALIILVVNPVQTLWFLVFILVLQQIDGNILGPKIVGESIGISAFWVIFAIIIGGGLFGIIGMIVGVPVFAFIYAFMKSLVNRKLQQQEKEKIKE